MNYNVRGLKNIIKQKGRIDPATVKSAEEQLRKIHMCYDERCKHHKNCAYESDHCDPDTCHFTSRFYNARGGGI